MVLILLKILKVVIIPLILKRENITTKNTVTTLENVNTTIVNTNTTV